MSYYITDCHTDSHMTLLMFMNSCKSKLTPQYDCLLVYKQKRVVDKFSLSKKRKHKIIDYIFATKIFVFHKFTQVETSNFKAP